VETGKMEVLVGMEARGENMQEVHLRLQNESWRKYQKKLLKRK